MNAARVRALVENALERRAFPAAVIEVGGADGPIWREAFGRLRYDSPAPATTERTVFDLASLTKVIATASLVMRLVERESLKLEDSVGRYIPEWPADDDTRIRHLLDHSSGLPAHARFWETLAGRDAYQPAIAGIDRIGRPGDRSVYSDLGFMLLGFIVSDVGGAPLDAQFAAFAREWSDEVRYLPPPEWLERTAPTEIDTWRARELRGEVHDENAAALGGVAAHAGLFGTAEAVGRFAQLVLATARRETILGAPSTLETFTTRAGVPGSSRALAWDTMLPTSSCGHLMSARSVGHTGFTGTSLWIDLDKNFYVVILTNRVHPTRANEQLLALRAPLHDAIVEALEAR